MCFLHIMKTISEGKESSLKLNLKQKKEKILNFKESHATWCFLSLRLARPPTPALESLALTRSLGPLGGQEAE